MIYSNSDDSQPIYYKGLFQNAKRHGQGVLTYKDGTTQIGEFVDDNYIEQIN